MMRDILYTSPNFLHDTHVLYKRTANKHFFQQNMFLTQANNILSTNDRTTKRPYHVAALAWWRETRSTHFA